MNGISHILITLQVENMIRWGNKRANQYWEALVPEGYYIPDENDNNTVVERWIIDKYEKGLCPHTK